MIFKADPPGTQPAPDLYGHVAIYSALWLTRGALQHLSDVAGRAVEIEP